MAGSQSAASTRDLLSILWLVVGLNLAYFGIEFAVALAIGSVSLFADSVDFLEDTALNGLLLAALRCSPLVRAKLGRVLAAVLLVPAAAMLLTLVQKFTASTPRPPAPVLLMVAGLGALLVNATCALLLARVRGHAGSLTRAAFLSARNDTVANLAIILAGAITALRPSIWPDIVVGVGIAALNADAAWDVWIAAGREQRAAVAAVLEEDQ